MIRFISQRDKFRCGPVAVVNVRKWLGLRVTYDDVLRLSRRWRLSPRPNGGSSGDMLDKALGVKVRIMEDEKRARQIVSAGNGLVISSVVPGGEAFLEHVWFCPGGATYKGKFFYLGVNLFKGETLSAVCAEEMADLLRLGLVWVIKRTGRPSTV